MAVKVINRNNFEVYTHGVNKQGRRFTVCLKSEQISSDECEIRVGVAECSNKDNFSKKIGRNIALGRASKRASRIYHMKINEDLFSNVLKDMYTVVQHLTVNK